MRPSAAEQAEEFAAQGRVVEGLRVLEAAAARRDADAFFQIALWRLSGQYLPRDLAVSRAYFAHAADAGRADAAAIHAAFLANGTGGDADWPKALAILRALAPVDGAAREQLAILAAMDLDFDGAPRVVHEPELLSEQPFVRRFAGLFSAAECDFLARCAEPWLQPAVIVDPWSGRHVLDPVRRSDSAAFPLAMENPAIHALNRRIAAASGTLVKQGEPLQVLSYRAGQEYRPHLDALGGVDNQRILTVLVYLNDGYSGGETVFTESGLAIRGRRGDAIMFRNIDGARRADLRSRHAGLPVTAGRKLIASRWIRERPLDLGDRPGR